MKFFKKIKQFFPIVSVFLIPVVLVSCSFNVKNSSLNLNEQLDLIKKTSSKQLIFDQWVSETYVTLYVENNLKDVTDRSKTKEELKQFLINLDQNKLTTLSDTQKKEFTDNVYEAYKFYVTFRSSIETDSEQIKPFLYFVTKAQEWKENKFQTINANHDSLLKFNPKPGVLETKTDWNQDETFKLLFRARGTGIYGSVMKLLMAEMYFLTSSKTEIENGTDYKKKTQNPSSKNYLDLKSFDIDDGFFFLNKYLIEKNPQFKWGLTADASKPQFVESIKNFQIFNNLIGITADSINETLVPFSSDKFGNNGTTNGISNRNLKNLHGFLNLENDSTINEGDLATNIDIIKTFGYEKSGMINNANKLLFSFENLEARKVIDEMKSTSDNTPRLPIIKIKKTSIGKETRLISLRDIEMKLKDSSTEAVFDENNPDELKLITGSNDKMQSWTITKLSFPPVAQKNKEKKINLNVKYEFTYNSKKHTYWYNFDIEEWNDYDTQSSLFKDEYSFNGSSDNEVLNQKFISSINPWKDDTNIEFSYILRPLPIFKSTGSIVIGEMVYMTGKFSLENTIWSSILDISGKSNNNHKPKKNLAHWFVLKDKDFWKNIQDFYLFNNYDIESSNSEIKTIISELGLTKKTKNDRKNAGIEF